jgi:hypothetical protein
MGLAFRLIYRLTHTYGAAYHPIESFSVKLRLNLLQYTALSRVNFDTLVLHQQKLSLGEMRQILNSGVSGIERLEFSGSVTIDKRLAVGHRTFYVDFGNHFCFARDRGSGVIDFCS